MSAGWRLQLAKWSRINDGKKTVVDEIPAPSRNDEYLLYQTLLGSFPVGDPRGKELAAYRDRVQAYMQKAVREAKRRTSWAMVNDSYEAATAAFVAALLDDSQPNAFLEDFRAAARAVTWVGFLNSLSMAAVKLTSPGVPDIYQGNETWDFSLVDPDNRRPVDYAMRRGMLEAIERLGDEPRRGAGRHLLEARGRPRQALRDPALAAPARGEPRASSRAAATRPCAPPEPARATSSPSRAATKTASPSRWRRASSPGSASATGELPCGAVWQDTRIVPGSSRMVRAGGCDLGQDHRVADGGLRVARPPRPRDGSVLLRGH
jgi:hypothetical protein